MTSSVKACPLSACWKFARLKGGRVNAVQFLRLIYKQYIILLHVRAVQWGDANSTRSVSIKGLLSVSGFSMEAKARDRMCFDCPAPLNNLEQWIISRII